MSPTQAFHAVEPPFSNDPSAFESAFSASSSGAEASANGISTSTDAESPASLSAFVHFALSIRKLSCAHTSLIASAGLELVDLSEYLDSQVNRLAVPHSLILSNSLGRTSKLGEGVVIEFVSA